MRKHLSAHDTSRRRTRSGDLCHIRLLRCLAPDADGWDSLVRHEGGWRCRGPVATRSLRRSQRDPDGAGTRAGWSGGRHTTRHERDDHSHHERHRHTHHGRPFRRTAQPPQHPRRNRRRHERRAEPTIVEQRRPRPVTAATERIAGAQRNQNPQAGRPHGHDKHTSNDSRSQEPSGPITLI